MQAQKNRNHSTQANCILFAVFVKKEDILNFNYDLTEVLKKK
jgi:hypothetical protein